MHAVVDSVIVRISFLNIVTHHENGHQKYRLFNAKLKNRYIVNELRKEVRKHIPIHVSKWPSVKSLENH